MYRRRLVLQRGPNHVGIKWAKLKWPGSYFHTAVNPYTTIPNHPGNIPEGTLRAIRKQAFIEPDTFLARK